MKRWGWAVLVAVGVWLGGCGEGGSLPAGEPPAPTGPDETVELPPVAGEPPPDGGTPSPGGKPPPPAPSLWPLTPGSSWTYRITDPLRGVFEKTVVVEGPETVPETSVTATAVRSTQPHLEELSWQLEKEGVVFRLREEDRKRGLLARMMIWRKDGRRIGTMKSLSRERPVGWSNTLAVTEQTRYGGDVELKEKTFTWRVVAVGETVTTPAGTFTNAMKVLREREDKEGRERTYWLVPGVGKVKEEGERTEELLRYEVKQP
jgi:hypothetical protein